MSRDCNGESNGRALEEAAIIAENAAAANGDSRGLALLNKCESRSDTIKILYFPKPLTFFLIGGDP